MLSADFRKKCDRKSVEKACLSCSVLHHHIFPYRELDYGHILNSVYRQVHGLMMRIVAYEFDISFFLWPVDVFHRQILVAVKVKRYNIHFSVNHIAEVVDPLESDDVSWLKNGIHTVSVDKDSAIARGYARNQYLTQCILPFVRKQRPQIGCCCDVVVNLRCTGIFILPRVHLFRWNYMLMNTIIPIVWFLFPIRWTVALRCIWCSIIMMSLPLVWYIVSQWEDDGRVYLWYMWLAEKY